MHPPQSPREDPHVQITLDLAPHGVVVWIDPKSIEQILSCSEESDFTMLDAKELQRVWLLEMDPPNCLRFIVGIGQLNDEEGGYPILSMHELVNPLSAKSLEEDFGISMKEGDVIAPVSEELAEVLKNPSTRRLFGQ